MSSTLSYTVSPDRAQSEQQRVSPSKHSSPNKRDGSNAKQRTHSDAHSSQRSPQFTVKQTPRDGQGSARKHLLPPAGPQGSSKGTTSKDPVSSKSSSNQTTLKEVGSPATDLGNASTAVPGSISARYHGHQTFLGGGGARLTTQSSAPSISNYTDFLAKLSPRNDPIGYSTASSGIRSNQGSQFKLKPWPARSSSSSNGGSKEAGGPKGSPSRRKRELMKK